MGTSNTARDDLTDAFRYTLTPDFWTYCHALSDDFLRRSIVLQLLSEELINSMGIDDLIKTIRAVYKENNLQADLSIGSSNDYDFVLKNGDLAIVSGNNLFEMIHGHIMSLWRKHNEPNP